jgi:ABC-type dipeptide/oligopeptide/nickel transport system permease subunit
LGGIIILILILILTYIFADVIAVKPYDVQVPAENNAVPQWIVSVFPMIKGYAWHSNAYPLGADDLGRDLFSRIVYGTRVSLTVAFVGPLIVSETLAITMFAFNFLGDGLRDALDPRMRGTQ